MFAVQNKFGLPTEAILHLYESDTEVDKDVLTELIETKPDVCLTIKDLDEGMFCYSVPMVHGKSSN